MHRTRCYRHGALTDEDFPLEQVSEHLESESAVVWVHLGGDDLASLQLVAEELGLHSLAVEDATSGRQRPKFDRYAGHDFLTAYVVRLDVTSGELVTSELAAFLTPDALVTVDKENGLPVDELVARWDDNVELTAHGVGALAHGLLDLLVDGLFEAVQSLDDQIEQLEDLLFDDRPRDKDVQRRSFELRKSLVRLRRVVLPMREVVNSMMRRDVALVTVELAPYYQDVYDHVLRATEWTESPARPGQHHRGDQPDDPGQPAQHHHQAGDQLGGHHRRPHRDHRLLRPERAVPGLRPLERLRLLGVCSSWRCRSSSTSCSVARAGCSRPAADIGPGARCRVPGAGCSSEHYVDGTRVPST